MLTMSVLTMSLLTGCGGDAANTANNAETATEASTTPEPTPEPTPETEPPHEHTYTETITTEPTCEADGEATYTCECGDSYTEVITATGHVFETYTSNNDATYTADGTETAKCNNCDVTDTRTAEGSMLTYTYTDMDATMYAQQTVNVRSMPSTDGEKLGSLSTNDEVKVTGQCAETSWYRIEYSGGVAYVSDSYLGNDKVVVQAEAPKQTQTSELPTFSSFAEMRAYVISLGYPLGTAVDNGDGTATAYFFDFDGETSFADTWPNQSHDVSNARNQARIILVNDGFHYMGRSQASKVAVAKDPAGFTYYVYGEKNWHKPTNCDGTSCY